MTEPPTAAAAGKCPPSRATVAGAVGATCGGAGASLGGGIGRRAKGVAGDACAWRRDPRSANAEPPVASAAGCSEKERSRGTVGCACTLGAQSSPTTAPAATEAGSKQAFLRTNGCCVVRLAMTPFLLTRFWWFSTATVVQPQARERNEKSPGQQRTEHTERDGRQTHARCAEAWTPRRTKMPSIVSFR